MSLGRLLWLRNSLKMMLLFGAKPTEASQGQKLSVAAVVTVFPAFGLTFEHFTARAFLRAEVAFGFCVTIFFTTALWHLIKH